MTEPETRPEFDAEDFSDDLSDEALDRDEGRACFCCTCSQGT